MSRHRHLTFGRNHAAKLGFDPAKLAFNQVYSSANGLAYLAKVRVREFRLDNFVMRDVPVSITKPFQPTALVGIDILRRLNLRLQDGNCLMSWS